MALTTVNITGTFNFPDASWTEYTQAEFMISGYDTDTDVVVPRVVKSTLGPLGELDVDLWGNDDGIRGTIYGVNIVIYSNVGLTREVKRIDLGRIQIQGDGPFNIADLLDSPATVPGAWYSTITEAEYDAAIQAAADAVAAAAAAEAAANQYIYEDRATAEAASVPAPIDRIGYFSATGDSVFFVRDPSGTALTTGDGSNWSPDGRVTPQHWGFVADGSAGHTAKFQAALDWCKSEAKILFCPSGEYLLEDELECYYFGPRLQPYGIWGEDMNTTIFYHNVNDATKTIFNWARNDGQFQSFNQSDKTFGNFTLLRVDNSDFDNVSACMMDLSALGNSRVENIFLGTNMNTAIRMSRNANLFMREVYSNGAGYSFPLYDTSVLDMSGTSGTNTLTVSGGTPCSTDHIGMTVLVNGGGTAPVSVFTITDAPTTDTYTVAETITSNFTNANFVMGEARVSGASGGNTLTSPAPIFRADQVGLYCYTELDGGGIVRFRITGVTDSRNITIDCSKDAGDPTGTAATLPDDVTDGIITVANWDISDRLTRGNGQTDITNDIIIQGGSIHRGAGAHLVIKDVVRGRIIDNKIHGQGPDDWRTVPGAAIWSDNAAFRFEGQMDSNFAEKTRIRCFNLANQGISIGHLFLTLSNNQSMIKVPIQSGVGFVDIGSIRGNITDRDVLIDDDNTSFPRVDILGAVDGPYSGNDRVEFILPRRWETLNGGKFRYDPVGGFTVDDGISYLVSGRNGLFTPEVADAETGGNVGTAGTAHGRWSRVGRQVLVTIRLFNVDTTGMTAGNNIWIRGLPFTSTINGADRFIGPAGLDDVTFSGYVTAYMANNTTAFRLMQSASGSATAPLTVAGLTSGAATLNITLTYETADP